MLCRLLLVGCLFKVINGRLMLSVVIGRLIVLVSVGGGTFDVGCLIAVDRLRVVGCGSLCVAC